MNIKYVVQCDTDDKFWKESNLTFIYKKNRAGALVQWLKLPALKVGDLESEPHSGLQVSKKQNVSFPLTRKTSIPGEEPP